MSEVHALQLIRQQIIRDGRSLLQYVGSEAVPYIPPPAAAARARLEKIATEENDGVGKLIRYLQRHHTTPPLLGAYPSNFTTLNFTALEHLLPSMEQELASSIAALEQGLARLPESDARQVLAEYLDVKRRHLRTLRKVWHADAQAEAAHPSVIPSTQVQPAH